MAVEVRTHYPGIAFLRSTQGQRQGAREGYTEIEIGERSWGRGGVGPGGENEAEEEEMEGEEGIRRGKHERGGRRSGEVG